MQHGQTKCSGKKIWFFNYMNQKSKNTNIISFFLKKILFSLTLPSLPQLGISCLLQKDINGQWSEWVWPRRIHFWVLSFCVGGKMGQFKRKTGFPVKAFAISHVPESCAAFMVCWSCRRISCLFVTIGFYLHGCQHRRGKKRQHLCSENLQNSNVWDDHLQSADQNNFSGLFTTLDREPTCGLSRVHSRQQQITLPISQQSLNNV